MRRWGWCEAPLATACQACEAAADEASTQAFLRAMAGLHAGIASAGQEVAAEISARDAALVAAAAKLEAVRAGRAEAAGPLVQFALDG